MQVSLDDHLDYEEDSEDFVAGSLVGLFEFASEDVAEAEEAFGELVVGSGEVEDCQGDGVYWCWRGEGVEVFEDVVLELGFLGWRVLHPAWGGDAAVVGFAEFYFQFRTEAFPEGGQESRQDVGKEDAGEDVSRSTDERWETLGICFNLHNVTVLLSQGAVPQEGGQSQVEHLRKD